MCFRNATAANREWLTCFIWTTALIGLEQYRASALSSSASAPIAFQLPENTMFACGFGEVDQRFPKGGQIVEQLGCKFNLC